MKEEKAKRLIVAGTVGAVLLLLILVLVMVYQLISIGVKKQKEAELDAKIAEYKRLIEEEGETEEAVSSYWWIVQRSKELGYVFDGDKIYINE